MNNKKIKVISIITAVLLLSLSVIGCGTTQDGSAGSVALPSSSDATTQSTTTNATSSDVSSDKTGSGSSSEVFSDRDLEQSVNLESATAIELVSDTDVTLSREGIYVLSGEAVNVSVVVEAPEDAKVQIVLDGINVVNDDSPVLYVKTGDKVFITSTDSKNHMEVSGSFVSDGDTNLDAVIFSMSDLTLNGIGDLNIVSDQGNGISSKDDLVITGGVYSIVSDADALEANDSICIYDGTMTIETGKDGLHSENEEDASLGYVYIENGTLNISAGDDAIRANSYIQIDGGIINVETSVEGFEANVITINDGEITIYAKDDGINAARKVDAAVAIVINGGSINVTVGSGDTDAFDSNGNITINGGTVIVSANSAFDASGTAVLNDGDVTVNGTTITQIIVTQGGGGGGKPRR